MCDVIYKQPLNVYLSIQMNRRDVSGEKCRHTSTKKCLVIVRPEVVKTSGKKVKHFVAALQNRQKDVVVNVFGVINVFSDGSRTVGLASSETRDGGGQDDVVTRF